MYAAYGMGELAVAPLDANYVSAVTAVTFSPTCEALWAGTASGHVYTLGAPSLRPYAHWQAHPPGLGPVLELLAAPGGEGVLSLSAHRLALHGLGGAPHWFLHDKSGQLTAVCLEGGAAGGGGAGLRGASPSSASGGVRVALGRNGPLLSLLDLATGKVAMEQDVLGLAPGEGLTLLRGPVSRGALCAATSHGRLALIDTRAKPRLETALLAAPGGISALDARGDTVAAAGYSLRGGAAVAENCVKIFDLRAGGLRLLSTLPTGGPPACLAFHPLLPSGAGLLLALPTGLFCLADTAAGAAACVCQADMHGDTLTAASLSPSGELVALGGTGGYVHVWGDCGHLGGHGHAHAGAKPPRVNTAVGSVAPQQPPQRPRPAVDLKEEDSFSAAPTYPPTPPPGAPPGAPASYASDLDPFELTSVGAPPRHLEPGLRRDVRKVDGLAYLPNPHYSRAKPLGTMVRELAGLRHGPAGRLPLRPERERERADPAAARAERQRQRAAEGGVVLPLRYQYVEIRHYGRLKWEEFDFSYYNRTRFAGLENDQPNAYCNALLQALYFIPEFRSLALSHVPEPDSEFCLSCEISFLFQMLQRAAGLPCQATNLLRTLRSLREAAALGLLAEGGGIGPAAGAAADAGGAAAAAALGGSGGPGAAETELSRRVAALSRFVLEQMHRDATNARTPSSGPARSGIAPQPAPANAAFAPALESLMGISFRQRMTCLQGQGAGAESVRDARAFQLDLQYPPSRERAAKQAEEARQLGLNRLPHGAAPQQQDDPPGGGPPPFSALLRRSLLSASATRAWMDEAKAYTHVRKVRVPVCLPPLLTVNAAVADSEEAAWWLPAKGPDGSIPSGEANRLPWAIAIISRPQAWEVEVHQADSADQLYDQLGASLYGTDVVSAVYELCGAVFQIRDLDEAGEPGSTAGRPHQGHLVTLVKVPQQYWEEVPEPRLPKPPPGSLALFAGPPKNGTTQPAAAVSVAGTTAAAAGTATVTAVAAAPSGKQAAGKKAGRNTAGGAATAAATPAAATAAAAAAPVAAAACEAVPARGGSLGGIQLPDNLDDIFAGGLCLGGSDSTSPGPKDQDKDKEASPQQGKRSPAAAAGKAASPSAAAAAAAAATSGAAAGPGPGPGSAAGGAARRSPSSGGAGGASRGHPQGPEWVLFNDFSVSPGIPPAEVTATFANQKLPCMLQYRQVPPPPHLRDLAAASAAASPPASAAASSAPTTPLAAAPAGPAAATSPLADGAATAPARTGADAAAAAAAAATQDGKSPPPPANATPATTAPAKPAPATTLAAIVAAGTGKGRNAKQPASAASSSPASPAAAAAGSSTSCGVPRPTPEQFRLLCSAPPLQGPMAGLPPFRFKPLDPGRLAPRPGLRFAIDAEFVASSPPTSRAVERTAAAGAGAGPGGALAAAHGGGVDLVQLKQARLTLARVAVVLAEPGPQAGSCCLDDYVRAVEPVYDYLTRWSGIQPGDLDPGVSRHYTTTLKHTYLKLKYLLDCGCVFVGHDLRKDFRVINMVVPPEQVVDTSELFRYRGGRKLSLRFLASYLLGASMQGASGAYHPMHAHPHPGHPFSPGAGAGAGKAGYFGPGGGQAAGPGAAMGHDAIEDARMAMRLYHKYLELTANGTFHRVLNELYAWGKQHGWDPVPLPLRNGAAGQPQAPGAAAAAAGQAPQTPGA